MADRTIVHEAVNSSRESKARQSTEHLFPFTVESYITVHFGQTWAPFQFVIQGSQLKSGAVNVNPHFLHECPSQKLL